MGKWEEKTIIKKNGTRSRGDFREVLFDLAKLVFDDGIRRNAPISKRHRRH